jgi:copper chaperone CopZ
MGREIKERITMKETLIPVDGLLTVHCARNVEAALKRLPGVHHADANYLNSTATVHYDETQVSLDRIQATVRDCGYVCGEGDGHEHAGHSMAVTDHAAMAGMETHAGHMHAEQVEETAAHAAHAAHGIDCPCDDGPRGHVRR